jgi:SAM-dependent methyltransferase
LQRVLKKRGRLAVVLPHRDLADKAALIITNRDQSEAQSFVIDRPSLKIGPRYFSISEDVVGKVLDKLPWVRTVLDPMCGAGTIVKVARERGLEAYGCDIDPEAVECSRKRLAASLGSLEPGEVVLDVAPGRVG